MFECQKYWEEETGTGKGFTVNDLKQQQNLPLFVAILDYISCWTGWTCVVAALLPWHISSRLKCFKWIFSEYLPLFNIISWIYIREYTFCFLHDPYYGL